MDLLVCLCAGTDASDEEHKSDEQRDELGPGLTAANRALGKTFEGEVLRRLQRA